MQKSYNPYLLIALFTISISLAGMEKNQQKSQLNQSDSNTLVLKPLGGHLSLEEHNKDEMRHIFKDNTIRKAIHYTAASDDDKKHPAYKRGILSSAIPLNLFTESKSYTFTHNNTTVTIMSDQVYNEERFDTYNDYWNNILSNKYTYDEYMKKIRNNQ